MIRIIFLCVFSFSFGQTSKSLNGVISFKNELISDAYVEISINNFKKNAVSSLKGEFIIDKIPDSVIRINVKISHLQYESVNKEIHLNQKLNNVYINFEKEASFNFKEVVISGVQKKFINQESDKTIITVRNNDFLNSGSTFEAISKIPGIIITSEGLIGQNGKLSTIFIDGEPSGLTSDNLIAYLNSLPANSIEKIELIPNPGAKYQATFSGGIINIITSNLKFSGYSVSINTNNRINHNFKTSNSVHLLLKNKKINNNFFVGSNNNRSDQTEKYNTIFNNINPNQELIENRTPIFNYAGFYIRNNFKYSFSKKTSYILNYNFNKNSNDNLLNFENYSINLNENFNSKTKNQFNRNNINNEIVFKINHKIDTIGSNFELTLYSNFFNEERINKLSEFNILNSYSFLKFNTITKNLNLRFDAEFPFKKQNITLYSGLNTGVFNAKNVGNYFLNSNTPSVFNENIFQETIPFIFENKYFALYTSISKKINKLSFSLGLRYENINYENYIENNLNHSTESYKNLFPNLNIFYKLNDVINISSSYNRKINIPNYNNFDPNNNLNSFYHSNIGNPLLIPEFSNNFNSKITFFDYAYLSFSKSYLSNRNVPFYSSNPNSFGVIQSLVSLENTNNQNINLGLPIPFSLFYKGLSIIDNKNSIDPNKISYFFVDLSYNKTIFNNDFYKKYEKGNFMIYLYSQIILLKNLKMYVNYNFTSKGSVDIYELNEPIQNLDVFLSTKFLKNKLNLNLGVLNILNTLGFNANFTGNNIISVYNRKNETRMLRLSLTYNFGVFNNSEEEEFKEDNNKTIEQIR